MTFFLTGIIIGLCIALPFGANALLCLKNTLSFGWKSGVSTGLGIATIHGIYSFIGLSGLLAIESLLPKYIGILECMGGLFLCYFGLNSILNKKYQRLAEIQSDINSDSDINTVEMDLEQPNTMKRTYVLSALFALTNPKTMILSAIMLTESGILTMTDFTNSASISTILGIFIGSIFWWVILASSVTFIKRFLNYMYLIWLDRAFGLVVIGFGIFFTAFGLSKISFPPEFGI